MKPVSGVKMTYRYEGRDRPRGAAVLAGGSVVALLMGGLVSWRLRQ
jgi:hypothetical protein